MNRKDLIKNSKHIPIPSGGEDDGEIAVLEENEGGSSGEKRFRAVIHQEQLEADAAKLKQKTEHPSDKEKFDKLKESTPGHEDSEEEQKSSTMPLVIQLDKGDVKTNKFHWKGIIDGLKSLILPTEESYLFLGEKITLTRKPKIFFLLAKLIIRKREKDLDKEILRMMISTVAATKHDSDIQNDLLSSLNIPTHLLHRMQIAMQSSQIISAGLQNATLLQKQSFQAIANSAMQRQAQLSSVEALQQQSSYQRSQQLQVESAVMSTNSNSLLEAKSRAISSLDRSLLQNNMYNVNVLAGFQRGERLFHIPVATNLIDQTTRTNLTYSTTAANIAGPLSLNLNIQEQNVFAAKRQQNFPLLNATNAVASAAQTAIATVVNAIAGYMANAMIAMRNAMVAIVTNIASVFRAATRSPTESFSPAQKIADRSPPTRDQSSSIQRSSTPQQSFTMSPAMTPQVSNAPQQQAFVPNASAPPVSAGNILTSAVHSSVSHGSSYSSSQNMSNIPSISISYNGVPMNIHYVPQTVTTFQSLGGGIVFSQQQVLNVPIGISIGTNLNHNQPPVSPKSAMHSVDAQGHDHQQSFNPLIPEYGVQGGYTNMVDRISQSSGGQVMGMMD